MTLEERIGAAITEYESNEFCTEAHDDEWARGLARAVVAVLPTADVSDEQILGLTGCRRRARGHGPDRIEFEWCHEHQKSWGSCRHAVVRALLDAQAAAHAAEVEALRAPAEHEWERTRPLDGLWCQRCGLAHAQWTGQPCEPGGALARLEARLMADRDRAVTEALEQAAQIVDRRDGMNAALTPGKAYVSPTAQEIRSLIPNGDEG